MSSTNVSPPDTPKLDLAQWVGREEVCADRIDLRIARALAATLDLDPGTIAEGDELPPLWHWVYFTPEVRRSAIGLDGHATRGGFLPPVELPSRMWAGGRLVFSQPLRVGEAAACRSRIVRCERKHGRSGELAFVTVEQTISGERGLALVEEHDIVYREPARPGAPPGGEQIDEDADEAEFRLRVRPDPVLLFRYSALTFNPHRIHYDHPYATRQEGYPGLVVHGPLIATLLLEAFRAAHPVEQVRRYAYRALGPLFDTTDFDLCGCLSSPEAATLWAECDGRVAMRAEVAFE